MVDLAKSREQTTVIPGVNCRISVEKTYFDTQTIKIFESPELRGEQFKGLHGNVQMVLKMEEEGGPLYSRG